MIVITRHEAMVEFLKEIGVIDEDSKVYSRATLELVRDQDVVGILPVYLAAAARTLTTVPLNIPQFLRGKELTVEEIRKYADQPRTYVIREVRKPGHAGHAFQTANGDGAQPNGDGRLACDSQEAV